MALGTFTATIRADGISFDGRIEGRAAWAGSAAFDFGTPGSTATSKLYFALTSEGYSSSGVLGTTPRTVYATEVMRKPYPDHADLDITTDGSDLVFRGALSNDVYDGDTSVSATAAAGAVSSGGNNSLAAAGTAVTNNSTLDNPIFIAQWDEYGGACNADRVTGDFALSVHGIHLFGTACIVITAVGRTSGHTQTKTITVRTRTLRAGSGLYAWAYTATIPIAGFTQGEFIDCNFVAYPKVGDADSLSSTGGVTTADTENLLRNQLTVTCDKAGTGAQYALVDAVSGNNATGVVSATYATAAAAPFQHYGKAVEGGANVVRYKHGQEHSIIGTAPSSRVANTEWAIGEPEPGHDSSDTTVRLDGTATYKTARAMFRNLKVRAANTSAYLDGEDADNFLRFRGCVYDNNGVGNLSIPPGYRTNFTRFQDPAGDFGPKLWCIQGFSGTRVAYHIDGGVITDSAGGQFDCIFGRVACLTSGSPIIREAATAAASPDGIIHCFNRDRNLNGGTDYVWLGTHFGTTVGVATYGNESECTTSNKGVWVLAADSSESRNHRHWIHAYNTVSGGRINWNYNNVLGSHPTRRSFALIGNAGGGYAIKTDNFALDGSNIENWGGVYGVNNRDNTFEDYDGSQSLPDLSTFRGEYLGVNSALVAIDGVAWVDNASKSGDGTGSGDYHPDTGSVILDNLTHAEPWLEGDLYGVYRSTDATARAAQGAVQPVPTLVVEIEGDAVADGGSKDLGPVSGSASLVASAAGLVGAAIYLASIGGSGGVTGVISTAPRLIASGGSSETASLAIDASGTGSVTITHSAGDGAYNADITWSSAAGDPLRWRGRMDRFSPGASRLRK